VKRPIIAIDIDDVLFPFNANLLDWHNLVHGSNLALGDYTSFRLEDIWGGTKAEATDKIGEFQRYPGSLEGGPLPGALEAIRQLKDRFALVVVTSRQVAITIETKIWLHQYFPDVFSGVYFANYHNEREPRLTKSELCQQLGIEMLVDDHLDYVTECAGQGMKAILFGDYPWNQADNLPEGVSRAGGWDEVVATLDRVYFEQAKNG